MNQIKQLLIDVLTKMNLWEQNAKSIDELPVASSVVPTAKIHVSEGGTSKALELQKLLNASISTFVNQVTSIGEITVDGNDVTIPPATWKIANINYSTSTDIIENVPFSATGTNRIDIIVANTLNQIYKVSGTDTSGIAIRPNQPLNTVIVTEINVTEDSLVAVPFPLNSNQIDAIVNANTPSASNPFATLLDIIAGSAVSLAETLTIGGRTLRTIGTDSVLQTADKSKFLICNNEDFSISIPNAIGTVGDEFIILNPSNTIPPSIGITGSSVSIFYNGEEKGTGDSITIPLGSELSLFCIATNTYFLSIKAIGSGSGTTPPLQDVVLQGNEVVSTDLLSKIVINKETNSISFFGRANTSATWVNTGNISGGQISLSGGVFTFDGYTFSILQPDFNLTYIPYVGLIFNDGTDEIIISPTSATKNGVEFATVNDISKLSYITITQPVDLDAMETRVNDLDAAVVLKGTWGAASGSFPSSTQAGWSYLVTSDGTIDGIEFKNGDRLISVLDNASTSVYAGNWYKADYTDRVNTVCGRTGNVTITSSDLSDFNTAVDALITTALVAFKTANYLDFTSSGQGQIDSKQNKMSWISSSSPYTGTSSTALQKLSNAGGSGNGSFQAKANTRYKIEVQFQLSGLSSTTNSVQFGILGSAGITSVNGQSLACKSATLISSNTPSYTAINSATISAPLMTTGTQAFARATINIEVVTSTAGTLIIAFATNVSTTPVVENHIIRFIELGASSTTSSSDIV